MRLFRKNNPKTGHKYESKEYDQTWWVEENLKNGLILLIIFFVIYGIYKLVIWI